MNSYFNTNQENGDTLIASEGKAKTQEDIILEFFRVMGSSAHFSPDAILTFCHDLPGGTPLTSVRRAMANLSRKGLLMKTEAMTLGSYGKQVHTWMLAKPAEGQLQLIRNGQTQG